MTKPATKPPTKPRTKAATKAAPKAAAQVGTKTARKPAAKIVKKPAAKTRVAVAAIGRTARAGAKSATVASVLPKVTPDRASAAKKKFEQGILARGEAATAGKPLPRGATHEIVGKAADGGPILKRRRFSLA
jgi:hypothetical protein